MRQLLEENLGAVAVNKPTRKIERVAPANPALWGLSSLVLKCTHSSSGLLVSAVSIAVTRMSDPDDAPNKKESSPYPYSLSFTWC